MHVSIRRTTSDDVALVLEQRLAFLRAVRGDDSVGDSSFVEATRSFIDEETGSGRMHTWVAETTRCVGIISLLLWARVPRPFDDESRDGYIINMYVEPGQRGRGLGRRLLDECLASRTEFGVGRFFLHATDEGRPLYESSGFRPNPNWLEWTPQR